MIDREITEDMNTHQPQRISLMHAIHIPGQPEPLQHKQLQRVHIWPAILEQTGH